MDGKECGEGLHDVIHFLPIAPWLKEYQKPPGESPSWLTHLCELNYKDEAKSERLTRIVCTVGPATRDIQSLEEMMLAGMSVARINMSHSNQEHHKETIQNIRIANANYCSRVGFKNVVGIAIDLKGSEIRTGYIDGYPRNFHLIANERIMITSDWNFEKKTNANLIYIDYNEIEKYVQVSDEIMLGDGEILLEVANIDPERSVECVIRKGGLLVSEMNAVFPGVPLDFSPVSQYDIPALHFAVAEEVDFVFVSMIRNVETVFQIRELLGERGKRIGLIAKIENEQSLEKIDDIIDAADGIIIARRSLSINLTPEKMFLTQKAIIAKCNKVGKPVICSQQIIESLVDCDTPVRSEIIDVANTVTDGCDAILLSRETSIGRFPLTSIRTLHSVCQEAEAVPWSHQYFRDMKKIVAKPADAAHAIAFSVVECAKACDASAIVVCTTSGRSARLIGRFRPKCPILAVTRWSHVARQLSICRNMIPVHYTGPRHEDWLKDVDLRVHHSISNGRKKGFIKGGDCVVLVSGWRQGAGFTNTLRIIYVHALEDEQLIPVIVKETG